MVVLPGCLQGEPSTWLGTYTLPNDTVGRAEQPGGPKFVPPSRLKTESGHFPTGILLRRPENPWVGGHRGLFSQLTKVS